MNYKDKKKPTKKAEDKLRRFTFPRQSRSVLAKDLNAARKMVGLDEAPESPKPAPEAPEKEDN